MTTTQKRPAARPVTRSVGGPQKSIVNAKALKNDIAVEQLEDMQKDIDRMLDICSVLEAKFKTVDLAEFPVGIRRRLERQIELAEAAQWATAASFTRAVEYAANAIADGSMTPRPPLRPKRYAPTDTSTPMGLEIEGLVKMEMPN